MDKTNFQLRTRTGKVCHRPVLPLPSQRELTESRNHPNVCVVMLNLPGFEAWHRVCALFWYSLGNEAKLDQLCHHLTARVTDHGSWEISALPCLGSQECSSLIWEQEKGWGDTKGHSPLSFRSFQTLKFLLILKAFPTILSACLPVLFFLLCSFSFSSRAPFQHLPSQ